MSTYLHESGFEPYRHVHRELFDTCKDRNEVFRRKDDTSLAKGFFAAVAHVKKSVIFLVRFIDRIHLTCCK